MNTMRQKEIIVYPKPVSGILNLEFADRPIQHLAVYDSTGILIMDKTPGQDNGTIDLSAWKTGVYIILLQTEKEVLTLKILVKNKQTTKNPTS